MKTLKFGFLFLAIIAFLFSCQKTDNQDDPALGTGGKKAAINIGTCGEKAGTTLWAGQHINVGVVEVVPDGTVIHVSYRITNKDWMISETHLSVKARLEEIPVNKPGNPQIGLFENKMEHDPFVSAYTYTVPVPGEYVWIAAHAVVVSKTGEKCGTLAELEALIPRKDVDIAFKRDMAKYYYDITLNNAGYFSGTVPAWCVDNNNMDIDFKTAKLVSSYSSTYDLSKVVPNKDNLDLLNYLMNNYYPKENFKVIQTAIWLLMNGKYPTDGHMGGISPSKTEYNRAVAVVDEVKANGEGFVPDCGQWVVILVDSGDRFRWQNVFFLAKFKIPVFNGEETAWGEGTPFTNSSWAMYFEYCRGNMGSVY